MFVVDFNGFFFKKKVKILNVSCERGCLELAKSYTK